MFRFMIPALFILANVGVVPALDTRLLPDDTEFLLLVNLEQIRSSEMFRANKEELVALEALLAAHLPPAVRDWLSKAGINVLTDVARATIALPAKKDGNGGVAIMEGEFNERRFFQAAEVVAKNDADKLRICRVGGRRALELKTPNRSLFLTIPDRKTILIALSSDSLAAAIARLDSEKTAKLKKHIKVCLNTVDNKQSIRFVTTLGAIKKLTATKMSGGAVKQVDFLDTEINSADVATVQVRVRCNDAKHISEVADVVWFFSAVSRSLIDKALSKSRPLRERDVFGLFRISKQESTVSVDFVVFQDAASQLIKSMLPPSK
ncbi:MAG: hypothetical protein FJ271_14120 [Planctomycetes bacterium]|nr:hypothetical protein [Planctomycetota bacterium]